MTEPHDPAGVGGITTESVVHRSSRSPEALRGALEAWLTRTLRTGAAPEIVDVRGTSANGQSSETILFDAEWDEDGRRSTHELVARVAPVPHDVPVFSSYDLVLQADTIRTVAASCAVPVPRIHHVETDAAVLGTPFFVMDRVHGLVPPDIPPYTFGDNWLHDATAAQQDRVASSMVEVLAELHGIEDPAGRFAGLRPAGAGVDDLDRRIGWCRSWYEFAARDLERSPLIERAFEWLDHNRPAHPGPTVLSWGDARLGNVIWRGFEPVAVLDWEMATLGPPELDLGWLLYAHRIFQELAHVFELPGLPDLLRPDDVATTYEARTGYAPRDLDFYFTFSAVQWAIIFVRVGSRQIHFGEIARPPDVDDLLRNRESLAAMLDGNRSRTGAP